MRSKQRGAAQTSRRTVFVLNEFWFDELDNVMPCSRLNTPTYTLSKDTVAAEAIFFFFLSAYNVELG